MHALKGTALEPLAHPLPERPATIMDCRNCLPRDQILTNLILRFPTLARTAIIAALEASAWHGGKAANLLGKATRPPPAAPAPISLSGPEPHPLPFVSPHRRAKKTKSATPSPTSVLPLPRVDQPRPGNLGPRRHSLPHKLDQGIAVVRQSSRRRLRICTAKCNYDAVRSSARAVGYVDVFQPLDVRSSREKSRDKPDVTWQDSSVGEGVVMRLDHGQQVNHFAGMLSICRKQSLAKRARQWNEACEPHELMRTPMTWLLPKESVRLERWCQADTNRTLIVKPNTGSQGKGIVLCRGMPPRSLLRRKGVAQSYIGNPLLIDGCKFDVRLYLLVSHVDPLRLWFFHDGLVRICAEPYEVPCSGNLSNSCVHLTNYAVNKTHADYDHTDGTEGAEGNKRSVRWLMQWLAETTKCDSAELWASMAGLAAHTLLSAHLELCNTYRRCVPHEATGAPCRCFEVLGFDMLIDEHLNPWLLEVNHSPSFRCEAALDRDIKGRVLRGALNICQALHPAEAVAEAGLISGGLDNLLTFEVKSMVVIDGWQWLGEWPASRIKRNSTLL